MSRRMLLLVMAVAAVAGCTSGTPDTAADEARLRAEIPVWWTHYNAGHADSVAALYAEDGVIQAPGLPAAVGRPAIQEYLASDIAASKAAGLTFQGGEITGLGVDGDLAWASGTFTVNDSAGASVDTGKYVSVYRRIDGQWKIILDSWNSNTAPAAPAPAAAPGTP